jgi:fused signal recognition particle receptor
LWAAQRTTDKPLSVYFIGIGEQLQDLQAFRADEFAQALIS